MGTNHVTFGKNGKQLLNELLIQYLHKKAIHANKVATLGKDVPSYATVKR